MRFILVSLFFLLSQGLRAEYVKPFKTDYCTFYPEGTLEKPNLWRDCCILHDLYMWAGGTEADRLAADKSLQKCVSSVAGTGQGLLMYMGVRVGSYSPIKRVDHRWNNAWPLRPSYQALTNQDIILLEERLNEHRPEIGEKIKLIFLETLYGRQLNYD